MKQVSLAVVAALSFVQFLHANGSAGSSPVTHENTTTTNSALVVHPGIGIPGIFALGMSLAELKKATGDTKAYTNSVGRSFFPSIGAICEPARGGKAVPESEPCNGLMMFVPSHPDYPDLHFTGSILGGPSFATGPVNRAQIVACFGEPTTHLVCEKPDSPSLHPDFKRCINTAIDFSVRYRITNDPHDREIMYYQVKGLWFWLTDDIVECLCVRKPTVASTDSDATTQQAQ